MWPRARELLGAAAAAPGPAFTLTEVNAMAQQQGAREIMICAHRGLTTRAPDNSLPAIAAAIDAGFPAVEIDVRDTSDGVLVLMHDPTVNRTSDGRGAVEHVTFQQIRQLHLLWEGRPIGPVPTLEEVMDLAAGRTLLYIDMKTDRVELVVGALRSRTAYDWTILLGSPEQLLRVHELEPRCRLHSIVNSRKELDELLRRVTPAMVEVSNLPDRAYVEYVHSKGLMLEIDTMGQPDRQAVQFKRFELWRRYLGCGADFMMSDYPEALRDFMESEMGFAVKRKLF
jgi:glycerophosphoryl diester phosphodiesterase